MRRNRNRKCYVRCENCGQVDIQETTHLDIEEDFYGADLLTFICHRCGKKGKSNIRC